MTRNLSYRCMLIAAFGFFGLSLANPVWGIDEDKVTAVKCTATGSVRITGAAGASEDGAMVGKRGSRKEVWTTLSSWHVAFFSTAILCGLILASPISRKRRVHSLIWGLLLLHVLVGLRMTIIVVYNLSMHNPSPLLAGDGFWSRSLRSGIGWASTGQMVSYLVPIGVWILVCFRHEDLGPLVRGERSD
ncbi:MAG: hypothetical protein IH987_09865 [Planctomycetes bacterium]|nr:hypothetical protein [Planctomycetota bacterium]